LLLLLREVVVDEKKDGHGRIGLGLGCRLVIPTFTSPIPHETNNTDRSFSIDKSFRHSGCRDLHQSTHALTRRPRRTVEMLGGPSSAELQIIDSQPQAAFT